MSSGAYHMWKPTPNLFFLWHRWSQHEKGKVTGAVRPSWFAGVQDAVRIVLGHNRLKASSSKRCSWSCQRIKKHDGKLSITGRTARHHRQMINFNTLHGLKGLWLHLDTLEKLLSQLGRCCTSEAWIDCIVFATMTLHQRTLCNTL